MKENLKKELERKGISYKAVCELLHITDRTLYNKISGQTAFTVDEAITIVRNLLPEYNLEYLFGSIAA
ncbi:MAG: XRE family transcriptional regulator [Clostridia bacterium]|nr:XRE family transcriptional regulator [Clostridia bacterium]